MQAAKRVVVWKVSLAGAAFRGWLRLIDSKRRREFLDWALGPEMCLLNDKVSAVGDEIRSGVVETTEQLRDEIGGHTRKLRQEMGVEKKAVRELLTHKVDGAELDSQRMDLAAARQELATVRDQIAHQAERHQAYCAGAERETSSLHQKLDELSRDVDERVAQVSEWVGGWVGEGVSE